MAQAVITKKGEIASGYRDLRDFIDKIDAMGELKVARGCHWDLEVGAVTELAQHRIGGPAVLFDEVVDHAPGYRILINSMGSPNRTALVLGLPTGKSYAELLPIWRERAKSTQPIPMKYVKNGPVMENVFRGKDVDITKFPTPKWHELDGGRYIGTGCVDILRDPELDWVNLGTYRVMLLDRNRLTLYISPGKHGRMIREKYFAEGKSVPVAISFGQDPLLFLAASTEVGFAECEYDWAGGVQGRPVEVIEGPVTGLPIPADAEIVVEGFMRPNNTSPEGPFGEWTGYYASSQRAEPIVEVEALYHRNNPIILGSPPCKPPSELTSYRSVIRSAMIMDELEKAGVPDVTRVWCHEPGGTRLLVAVAIKQRYPGHARQAGHIASMCHSGAYLGRFVVVVDDDIDVTDIHDLIWAMCTRCDPETDMDLIRRAWSGPLDPIIHPDKKGFNSRAIIDACRPYEWRDRFPPVAEASPELMAKTRQKWGELILGTQ